MNVKQLNYSLCKAAEHLIEAGKHMMIFNPARGIIILQEADMILSIIKPETEKIAPDKLESIIQEIMNIKVEDK